MNEAVFRSVEVPRPPGRLRPPKLGAKPGQESQEGAGWLLIRKVMENRGMKWDYGQV